MSEITLPTSDCNGGLNGSYTTAEAATWASNYIPVKTISIITYPFPTLSQTMSVKALFITCRGNMEGKGYNGRVDITCMVRNDGFGQIQCFYSPGVLFSATLGWPIISPKGPNKIFKPPNPSMNNGWDVSDKWVFPVSLINNTVKQNNRLTSRGSRQQITLWIDYVEKYAIVSTPNHYIEMVLNFTFDLI